MKVGINKIRKEKYKEPKDNRIGFKLLQILALAFIVLSSVSGVMNWVSRDDLALQKNMQKLQEFLAEPTHFIESDDVKVYAEDFIREYLRYDGDGKLSPRINEYFSMNSSMAKYPSELKSIQVIDTSTFGVEKINENELTVGVRALYKLKTEVAGEKGPTIQEVDRESFFNVYIYKSSEGKLAIATLPALVPKPEKASEVKLKSILLPTADSNVESSVKNDLESFFNAYYGGNENDIAFFMEGGKKLKGFNGEYKLKEISKVNVFITNTKEVLADVELTVTDGIITAEQTFEVVLVKSGSKNLIRSVSINNKDFNKYIKEEKQ